MSSPLSYLLASQTVSLNHLWTKDSPRLELNPAYNITNAYTHEGTLGLFPGGLSATAVTMEFSGQHGGPTIDAIGHIGVNGTVFGGLPIAEVMSSEGLIMLGIEEYPEDKYLNRGVLVDMAYCMDTDKLAESTIISEADLVECLEKEGVEIKEGDSVLIRTGYGALFNESPEEYMTNYPGPSEEVATYLAGKKIFLTGVDNASWDASNTPFPGHVILIPQNGIYIVENINLELLSQACQDNEKWEFGLVLNPPKIKGAAAGATNAFAIFPPRLPVLIEDSADEESAASKTGADDAKKQDSYESQHASSEAPRHQAWGGALASASLYAIALAASV